MQALPLHPSPACHSTLLQLYPGRAASTPLVDLLLTLLHWGASGWRARLAEREALYTYAQTHLSSLAEELAERVLQTPSNPISLAITLENLQRRVLRSCVGASAPSLLVEQRERAGEEMRTGRSSCTTMT